MDIVLLLLIGLGETLANEMRKRIMVLDGAMGTMIQGHNLTEEQFRNLEVRGEGLSCVCLFKYILIMTICMDWLVTEYMYVCTC